jgi:hypothetical protein
MVFIDEIEKLPEDSFAAAVIKMDKAMCDTYPSRKPADLTDEKIQKFRKGLQEMLEKRWGMLKNTSKDCPTL